MKIKKHVLSFLDIPGGSILGLFSLAIIALCCYSVVSAKQFPSEIRDIYLGVIAAFAATNISKHYKERNKNDAKN